MDIDNVSILVDLFCLLNSFLCYYMPMLIFELRKMYTFYKAHKTSFILYAIIEHFCCRILVIIEYKSITEYG